MTEWCKDLNLECARLKFNMKTWTKLKFLQFFIYLFLDNKTVNINIEANRKETIVSHRSLLSSCWHEGAVIIVTWGGWRNDKNPTIRLNGNTENHSAVSVCVCVCVCVCVSQPTSTPPVSHWHTLHMFIFVFLKMFDCLWFIFMWRHRWSCLRAPVFKSSPAILKWIWFSDSSLAIRSLYSHNSVT